MNDGSFAGNSKWRRYLMVSIGLQWRYRRFSTPRGIGSGWHPIPAAAAVSSGQDPQIAVGLHEGAGGTPHLA